MRAGNALPERLKLEPACQMRADERVGVLGSFVRNSLWLACCFSEKLRLARAIHGDKPPGSFVNTMAHRKQAMIPQDGRLFGAESAGDAITFGCFLDDAGVIVKDRVIFIKRASVLCKRI